jgi:acyl carrier protein phosphodiesterase
MDPSPLSREAAHREASPANDGAPRTPVNESEYRRHTSACSNDSPGCRESRRGPASEYGLHRVHSIRVDVFDDDCQVDRWSRSADRSDVS